MPIEMLSDPFDAAVLSSTLERWSVDGLTSASTSDINATAEPPTPFPVSPPWRLTLIGILLGLVILFTLVGNALVVAAVASTRRLRSSVTNYFVVSLAVADLTVAVFVMPYAVVYELRGQWTFGWVFCYFWISCDVTCCTASILHLCVISVDRYLAVTEPLTYRQRMSKRRALAAIAAVWTCSSGISFVPIFAGWFSDGEIPLYVDSPTCGLFVNRIYAVISSSTSFYLPLVVMLFLYAQIFRIARRQAAEIRQLEKSLQAAQRAPTGRQQRRSRRVSSDTKAVKTLGTLMGLFCASWLPFFVVYVAKPFCGSCGIPASVDQAITWLGYCNSFINPCVYAFLNRDFRSAFQRVLMCGVGGRNGPGSLAFASGRRRSGATANNSKAPGGGQPAAGLRPIDVGGPDTAATTPFGGSCSPLNAGGVNVRLKILRVPDSASMEHADWAVGGFSVLVDNGGPLTPDEDV